MFRNTAIGAAALGFCAGLALPAQAAYIVTLQQVGADVVATGSGALDLTDLNLAGVSTHDFAGIAPNTGEIQTGPATGFSQDIYTFISGPASFGGGSLTLASSGTGDPVGVAGLGIYVPVGYISGHALSDTSTYNTATFASLGVTPGTYEWTWGNGLHADSFTLQIGPVAAVPEPASLPLLVMGLAGLGMVVRRRRA